MCARLDCASIFHVTKWTQISIIQYFKKLPIYYTYLEKNQTPSFANLDSLSYCSFANMRKSPCLLNQDGQSGIGSKRAKNYLIFLNMNCVHPKKKIKSSTLFHVLVYHEPSKPGVKYNIMWSCCIMLHLHIHGPKSKLQLL
jgi:hypothetical protein